jgi:hypothetical protein
MKKVFLYWNNCNRLVSNRTHSHMRLDPGELRPTGASISLFAPGHQILRLALAVLPRLPLVWLRRHRHPPPNDHSPLSNLLKSLRPGVVAIVTSVKTNPWPRARVALARVPSAAGTFTSSSSFRAPRGTKYGVALHGVHSLLVTSRFLLHKACDMALDLSGLEVFAISQ